MNFISMLIGFLFHFKDLFPTHRDLTVNHQRSWSTFAAIQHWLYSTDKTDMPETNSRRYHETRSLWVKPCSLPEYEFHQQSMLNAILSHFNEFFPANGKMHSTDLTFASLKFLQSNTDCINSTDITDIQTHVDTNETKSLWVQVCWYKFKANISSCSMGTSVPFHDRSSLEERFCGKKRPDLFVVFSKRTENVLFSFFLHKTNKRYSFRKIFAVLSIIVNLY